jgi:hypothetical protein
MGEPHLWKAVQTFRTSGGETAEKTRLEGMKAARQDVMLAAPLTLRQTVPGEHDGIRGQAQQDDQFQSDNAESSSLLSQWFVT